MLVQTLWSYHCTCTARSSKAIYWDAGARQLSAAAPAPSPGAGVSAASQGAAPAQATAAPVAAPPAADGQSMLQAEAAAFVNATELFLAGARVGGQGRRLTVNSGHMCYKITTFCRNTVLCRNALLDWQECRAALLGD